MGGSGGPGAVHRRVSLRGQQSAPGRPDSDGPASADRETAESSEVLSSANELKLLLVVPTYPYPAYPMSGIFNERSAEALAEACRRVEVLAPRPLVPPGLRRLNARWATYSRIPAFERRNGIDVHRPGYIQVPGSRGALWYERLAYAMSRRLARRLHSDASFDAILSFDLLGGGPLAWRLGRDLGLLAAGWATGGDLRVQGRPAAREVARRALQSLDVLFYQSTELRAVAADLLGTMADALDPDRHVVLARGIPAPPTLDREGLRRKWRSAWNVGDRDVLVLYVGRITRPKGAYELLAAAERSVALSTDLKFVVVGASPGFDESTDLLRRLEAIPSLAARFDIVPACPPAQVWECLCAADIVAFPSHAEGMPNGVLEALAMELPVVAFAIPAVWEIDPRSEAILTVPPVDAQRFADALVRLAGSLQERRERGKRGHARVMRDFMIRRNMERAAARIADRLGTGRERRDSVPAARSAGGPNRN